MLDVVQANYAEPVDIDKAVYQGAIPGMLRMLDPHSNFFDARQFALLREDQRGKYYGVGMVVAPRENHTVVMSPYVGAPAYNAGIRPGDVIMKVDEKSTDGLTTSDVADMLKGAKGTIVKITVSREGYNDPLTFTVTRDEIPRHSVDIAFMLKPGVGYIRLSGFNETTDREIAEGLKKLNAASLDGLILDMRGKSRRVAERSGGGGRHVPGEGTADRFASRARVERAEVLRDSRESGQHGAAGDSGERKFGVGDRDCVGRGAGSRSRNRCGRDDVRQGFGADGYAAEREHRAGADDGAVLHAERTIDSARLQIDFAVRISLRAQSAGASDGSEADG